jgi:type II secretion system protein H
VGALSAAGPSQGACPPGGVRRAATLGGDHSAAGPSQGACPPGGVRREATLGGEHSAAGPSQGACPPGGVRREATLGGRRGFTLVEILVVIGIAALVVALAVANLGDDERRTARREARRLAGALEHAAALAQWQRVTLGVSASGDAYRFWKRGADDRWIAFAGDDVLAPRALPHGIVFSEAVYAGVPVAPDAILPLRPSGRNEPYALTLHSGAVRIVVAADPLNRVSVAPD